MCFLCTNIVEPFANSSYMKTEYQVQHFFTSQLFKSETDWEIVQLFCQKHHIRVGTFRPTYNESGISSEQFLKWYNDGFGCGDIAMLGATPVIISDSGIDVARLCAEIAQEGPKLSSVTVNTSELKTLPYDKQIALNAQLSKQGWEYDRKKLGMVPKWIPAINDRVLYHNQNESGLGVVRSILPAENKVELYCYYSYTTKQCGYSMHELNACTYNEFHFEPMTIVAQRRLNRELERYGKVWYDKLHRIEPVKTKVEVGQSYWYINDKMKVVQEKEKGTPTSQFRYIAGNYFQTHEAALEVLGHFSDYLRDRLAK